MRAIRVFFTFALLAFLPSFAKAQSIDASPSTQNPVTFDSAIPLSVSAKGTVAGGPYTSGGMSASADNGIPVAVNNATFQVSGGIPSWSGKLTTTSQTVPSGTVITVNYYAMTNGNPPQTITWTIQYTTK